MSEAKIHAWLKGLSRPHRLVLARRGLRDCAPHGVNTETIEGWLTDVELRLIQSHRRYENRIQCLWKFEVPMEDEVIEPMRYVTQFTFSDPRTTEIEEFYIRALHSVTHLDRDTVLMLHTLTL